MKFTKYFLLSNCARDGSNHKFIFIFTHSPLSIILEIIHDFANINANYPANIGGLNRKGSLNNTFSDM